MPSNFCLLPKHADELARRINEGELDVAALARMSSAERRGAFADIMGDANAQHVNAAFESKLLLKNQQKGLETWIRQATDIKPDVKRDLLARVERMDRVLQPSDANGFLADLAQQRLGFSVSQEEAGRIAELAKAAADEKPAALAAAERGEKHLPYGRAKVEFANYVSDLKNGVKQPRTVGSTLKDLAGASKSIEASLDNSALFRQGWKTLWSEPKIWAKNSRQSFRDIVQEFGGKHVMDEVQADILSRPNALNGNYRKAKLAIGTVEDQFPSSLPEKLLDKAGAVGVPLKRAYTASEAAYNGFLYRTRADVFDKYAEIAQASGGMDDPRQLESIGKLVNSLTGRGTFGKSGEGASDAINLTFFSLRKLKSDVDFLTAHQLQKDVTPFVRRQAAKNLVQTLVGTAAVLAVARAAAQAVGNDDAVEADPRSSDFGKIKVGNTRFDVTGGMGSLATLAARFATMSSKSSTSHVVRPLNSGKFGSQTAMDVFYNFFENKLSPVASVVRDLLKGEDRQGNRLHLDAATAGREVGGLFAPLPASNAIDLYKDPNSAGVLLGELADALGIATTNYGKPHKKAKQ
jgi:hypothetical protein